MELQILRVELVEIRSNQAAEAAQYEKEKALWAERIEMERKAYELSVQRVAITERERDLQAEKAVFYQNALNVCNSNKHRSFGCTLKRIFTLGLARCR